jgi:hypothetical protein
MSKVRTAVVLFVAAILTAGMVSCIGGDEGIRPVPVGDDTDDDTSDDSGDDDADDTADDDSGDDDTDDDDTGDDTGDDDDAPSIVFIHHSVGQTWIDDGGLADAFQEAGFAVFDITYGDGWFGDHTDPGDWPATFTTYYDEVVGWDLPAGETHDVVTFKSCFNASVLWSGELETFEAAYDAILTVFLAHPETAFLAMTAPPYADNGEAPAEAMARGREFAYWMTHAWAAGATNVGTLDLAGFLNDDAGFAHARDADHASYFYLRAECESEPGNSHPTGDCLAAATPAAVAAAAALLTR